MPQPTSNRIEYQLDLPADLRRQFVAQCQAKLLAGREAQHEFIRRREGRAAASAFSAVIDDILISMCLWLMEHSPVGQETFDRIAIVAQGGYGRAQMNPFSDVDLLVLMPDKPKPGEQAFVRSLLYLLWDISKLELGHATKRVTETTECLGVDLESTTALLELRLLFGSEAMVDEVRTQVKERLRGPLKRWFYESKLNESANRREKYGSSIYLLEPNVKEGEGGLRDVHSLKWLSYALLNSHELEVLKTTGALQSHELEKLNRAMDFLLSVRSALHLAEGRKIDVLSFSKQPVVARELNYTSDAVLLAEEKMMKDYYLHARVIDRYSQKAVRAMSSYFIYETGEALEAMRRRSLNDIYYARGGYLYQKTTDVEFFRNEPWRVMEAFRTAILAGVALSDELKQTIEESADVTDTDAFRRDPHCRNIFMDIMGQRSGVGPVIHAMHETGVLANYMPEFRKLFCLVRIDHYHRYTVDEHLIKTLYVLEELYKTGGGQRPELADEARQVKRWDLLNLSLLLHDIGKGEGHGHVLRGAVISQKMTQRMGLPTEDQEVVRQLILQHLKMVHMSQRRDLEDPTVIAEMAGTVPDPELLRMLYVLTYCDTQAVGPGTWSDWKGMLLYELYRKTVMLLQGRPFAPTITMEFRERMTAKVAAVAGNTHTEAEIAQFINNAPEKYLGTVDPAEICLHIQMQKDLSDEVRVAWHVEELPGMNYTEITTVGQDVRGLLSTICGALASKDINILGMQAYSTKDGHAIDVFQVTDLRGNQLPKGFRMDRLKQELNRVVKNKKTAAEAFPIRKRPPSPHRNVAVVKPTQILMNNDDSPDYTILEVKAYDRPGLLYDITRVCNEQGYHIHLAMITTEAYRVVDVFYITDSEFNKLTLTQTRRLAAALEEIISG